jgi:hypothetical protein
MEPLELANEVSGLGAMGRAQEIACPVDIPFITHFARMLRSGQPAPDFEAQSTLGRSIRLSDYRGKPVILFFFPKAFTPG